ncbi:MAG TPA: class I adenylate-forming enzyme family protein [Alphaproteobacteria bacterium]|nr:class I adenylate-forming enzyme family protein [Alphaproteobacteria bacterium]
MRMHESGNLGDIFPVDVPPEKPALILVHGSETERVVSYAHLRARSHAVARGLVRDGYQCGDRIAILAANVEDYLATYFGTMQAGCISVPVNWKLREASIHHVLRDSDSLLVFVDGERRASVPAGVKAVEFGPEFEAFLDPGPFEPLKMEQGEVAMFLYTSGSTGNPKGVPLTHAGHIWVTATRLRGAPDTAEHRALIAAPFYHMNALSSAKAVLAGGGTIVQLPVFTAEAYVDAIERHKATWLTSVPTMMALVVQQTDRIRQRDTSSVRMVRMGSAPATQGLFDQIRQAFPGARITYGYGTTEAGPCVFGPHPKGKPLPDLALGYPMDAPVRVRLEGDPQNNIGAGQPHEGELLMDCPALTPGYHKLPEKTAEVMTEDGLYRTGDVMRRDENGFYYFVGRVDDMFTCNGENVYPGEVEKVLENHPAIAQAALLPVPDDVRGNMPVAFVVPAGAVDEDVVKQHAIANAPAYMHPRRVWFVDKLPLASTNKIDKKALTAEAQKRLA